MATKKTTKKNAKKATRKQTATRRTASSKTRKSATAKARPQPRKRTATPTKGRRSTGSDGKVKGILRVRMYRIGFGDFFLLTVPTKTGPEHILIDCGVHKGDIHTMDECVQDLIKVTDRKLALVIATHYHADHLSGFASNFDDFAQFEVGAVWLSNRLDPDNEEAVKFRAQITSLSHQLRLGLGAREDLDGIQALYKVENALGFEPGAKEGRNEKALRLLTKGFKNKPPVYYYQGGDEPVLPEVLQADITAQLLGPSPKDSGGMFAGPENSKEQYLAAAAEEGVPETVCLKPFEKNWPATASDYPQKVFKAYGSSADMEKMLHDAQPDVLLAMATAIDGTLNNQSLVILFTCQNKKLLFVGDAQWGNWSYWLYGKKVTEKDKTPGITEEAREILGSIDFYKVGHHGSNNANPIPAVAALSEKCVSMCSTESADYDPNKTRPHGHLGNHSEVPRTVLMDALEKQTKNKLVRSDWIKVGTVPASPEAKSQLAKLPDDFSAGDFYIDYIFPT